MIIVIAFQPELHYLRVLYSHAVNVTCNRNDRITVFLTSFRTFLRQHVVGI